MPDRQQNVRISLAWLYSSTYFLGFVPNTHGSSVYAADEVVEELSSRERGMQSRNNFGVLLTEEQRHLASSSAARLLILGNPGTGKTLCLISKMSSVFSSISLDQCSTIIFVHESLATIRFVQGLFEKAVDRSDGYQYLFLSLGQLTEDVTTRLLSKDVYLFLDDIGSWDEHQTYADVRFNVLRLIDVSRIVWMAGPGARSGPLFFELLGVNFSGSTMNLNGTVASLSRTMRNTCHIVQFGSALQDFEVSSAVSQISAGHFVVGEKPTFESYPDIEEKEVLTRSLNKLSEGFEKAEFTVLYVEETTAVRELRATFSNSVTFASIVEFMGRESICVLLLLNATPPFSSRILEAAMRSISKLMILIGESQNFYFDGVLRKMLSLEAPVIGKRLDKFQSTKTHSFDREVQIRSPLSAGCRTLSHHEAFYIWR